MQPTSCRLHVAVCVPVRNERRGLSALLAALSNQTGIADHRITCCFLFDGCTDGSEALVLNAAADLALTTSIGRHGPGSAPNAGLARRAALALGETATAAHADPMLLTTDADSVPAGDWIAANVAALRHADVVAGRISRARARPGDPATRLEAYYDRLYAMRRAIDPVPWEPVITHHYTGAASLGFRASAYRLLGGFEGRASGEDAAIVDSAHRLGLRVRRDPAVQVRTSDRRHGRAPDGLAAGLRLLDRQCCGSARVGDPAAALWQYERHAAARAIHPALPDPGALLRLHHLLGLPIAEIAEVAGECRNAEAFAMRIVPAAPMVAHTVSLEEAEVALSAFERAGLGCAA